MQTNTMRKALTKSVLEISSFASAKKTRTAQAQLYYWTTKQSAHRLC